MTQRKSPEPLTKVTMNFFTSDYVWIADQFPTIGPQRAIREVIRDFKRRKQAQTAVDVAAVDALEISIED